MDNKTDEKELLSEKIAIEETNINLVSDIKNHNLSNFIFQIRKELKEYIQKNPNFAKSLKPINSIYTTSNHYNEDSENNIPKIAKLMIEASNLANVGPIAAIAGSIAEISLDYLIEKGTKYSIVDNGGDIAFINKYENENENRNVVCGIYAGNSPISKKIGFKFKKQNQSLGICSSSGSVGYSISYGRSDCVTIIAKKASIADSLATSIANNVNGKLDSDAVENGLAAAEELKENFIGALIIVGESVGTIGNLPKIVELDEKYFK